MGGNPEIDCERMRGSFPNLLHGLANLCGAEIQGSVRSEAARVRYPKDPGRWGIGCPELWQPGFASTDERVQWISLISPAITACCSGQQRRCSCTTAYAEDLIEIERIGIHNLAHQAWKSSRSHRSGSSCCRYSVRRDLRTATKNGFPTPPKVSFPWGVRGAVVRQS
jgi:hypothetical protein